MFGSEEEDDESPNKRPRINLMEKSLERVHSGIMKLAKDIGNIEVSEKCSRDMTRQILKNVYRTCANQLQRRAKNEVKRTG